MTRSSMKNKFHERVCHPLKLLLDATSQARFFILEKCKIRVKKSWAVAARRSEEQINCEQLVDPTPIVSKFSFATFYMFTQLFLKSSKSFRERFSFLIAMTQILCCTVDEKENALRSSFLGQQTCRMCKATCDAMKRSSSSSIFKGVAWRHAAVTNRIFTFKSLSLKIVQALKSIFICTFLIHFKALLENVSYNIVLAALCGYDVNGMAACMWKWDSTLLQCFIIDLSVLIFERLMFYAALA